MNANHATRVQASVSAEKAPVVTRTTPDNGAVMQSSPNVLKPATTLVREVGPAPTRGGSHEEWHAENVFRELISRRWEKKTKVVGTVKIAKRRKRGPL